MTRLTITSNTIKVSQLHRGTRINLGDSVATVSGMKWRNGSNGAGPYFISFNGRVAAALEISFEDHAPMLAHPNQDVIVEATDCKPQSPSTARAAV